MVKTQRTMGTATTAARTLSIAWSAVSPPGVPPRSAHLNRELFPGGRVPWLPVRIDAFLNITGEVVIHNSLRSARFQVRESLGHWLAPWLGRTDHRDWAMVFALNDDLSALLDSCQHGGDVAGQFRFSDPDGCHTSIIAAGSLT